MVDDTTEREVAIPAVYILGKNGLVKLCRQCPVKKSHFFQAHDQKNSCPVEHGQCLGEHPSEHQQNCSSSTQPASMVGLVKERWKVNPLKETTDYLNVSPAPGVLRNFYEISPKCMLAICLCLSLECPVWCSWSMQVSASAMRWNLYTCVKPLPPYRNYANHQFWLVVHLCNQMTI